MPTRMIAAVLAAAACTTTLATSAGSAVAESDDPAPAPTLADVLLSDGNQFDANPFDYDIVTEAVLLFPDLVAAASDPNAELTVFLPNDWAFRKLVADLTGRWPLREQAVFDAVAALGTETVATVLQYHIVPGPPISFEAATQSDGAELTTLQGATIEVDVAGRWWKAGATDRQRPRCARRASRSSRSGRPGVQRLRPRHRQRVATDRPLIRLGAARRRRRWAAGPRMSAPDRSSDGPTPRRSPVAQRAVDLLERGVPAVQVVHLAGYADQPHLTRSLKRLVGQTPSRIARAP